MKKLLIICGLAVLLIGAAGFDAGAALITGSIGFAGKVTPSPDGLAGATSLSFSGFETTAGPSGNFAAVPGGTPVTVNPLVFNPFTPATPWWSFTFGGNTFSLDTTSASVVFQGPMFLNIQGNGIAHETGFDATLYFYTATATVAPTGVDFVGGISNSAPTVPVPPSVLMLGSGLIGLVAIRRRFRK